MIGHILIPWHESTYIIENREIILLPDDSAEMEAGSFAEIY
jgi:hypothetical protein